VVALKFRAVEDIWIAGVVFTGGVWFELLPPPPPHEEETKSNARRTEVTRMEVFLCKVRMGSFLRAECGDA
jgi:hypothetical protein